MLLPLFFFLAFAADESAKLLPDAPGKEVVSKVCTECHDTSNIRKLRIPRNEWSDKMDDMVDRGAKGTDQEMMAILDYLTQNFGPDSRIFVNTAPFSELKSVLQLTNDETTAVIEYRKERQLSAVERSAESCRRGRKKDRSEKGSTGFLTAARGCLPSLCNPPGPGRVLAMVRSGPRSIAS